MQNGDVAEAEYAEVETAQEGSEDSGLEAGLETLGLKGLKGRARRLFGRDKAWIATAEKEDLIFALTSGKGLGGEEVSAEQVLGATSVEALRRSCREKFGGATWIASALRDTLVKALKSGKQPENLPTRKGTSEEFTRSVQQAVSKAVEAAMAHLPIPTGDEGTDTARSGLDEAEVRRIAMDSVERRMEPVSRLLHEIGDDRNALKGRLDAQELDIRSLLNSKDDSTSAMENVVREHLDQSFTKILTYVDQVRAEFAHMTDDRLDEKLEQLSDAITVKVQKKLTKEVRVVFPDGKKAEAGIQHKQFGELLQVVSCRLNSFLVGPAASGKTRAAEEVAKVLSLEFYPQSFNSQTPSSQLFGYMDAHGKYVDTVFRRAFEQGGLWLADEIDRANGNVMTALNAALENGYCSFPDKVVKRHEKFICVASANTWGRGADRMYVGANALDEATLNRFIQMEWEYDEELERVLTQNNDWCDRVQAIRKAVLQERVRHIVSPRASYYGATLLAGGMKRNRVEEVTIWRGMDEATRKKILASVPKTGMMVKVEGV